MVSPVLLFSGTVFLVSLFKEIEVSSSQRGNCDVGSVDTRTALPFGAVYLGLSFTLLYTRTWYQVHGYSRPETQRTRGVVEEVVDYALKNPFYSIDMPIRCELFDASLQECVDQAERVSYGGV
ncbi:hypothetical protein LSAT2_001620 [Lamellibrachia satsuma]|nr:hypothetical protein LSAT2_001620 [Lamellibrachia satsuma]